MAEERKGRGQLSSIDKLPPEADEHVLWAMGELAERTKPQVLILAEFNSRLAGIGEGPISKSAFNRASVVQAMALRKQEEKRSLIAALSQNNDVDTMDELNMLASSTISMLVLEALMAIDKPNPKETMQLAGAHRAAVAASKGSLEEKRRRDTELASKVDTTLGKLVAEKGMTAETAASIRSQVLGVKT